MLTTIKTFFFKLVGHFVTQALAAALMGIGISQNSSTETGAGVVTWIVSYILHLSTVKDAHNAPPPPQLGAQK